MNKKTTVFRSRKAALQACPVATAPALLPALDLLKEKRAGYREKIPSALGRQLGWTHFRMIIPMENELKRNFYAEKDIEAVLLARARLKPQIAIP